MSIVEIYKENFRVVYYDEDPIRAEKLKDYFNSRNYNFDVYTSRGLLFEALEAQLPHIFLLHYQPLNMRFQEIVKKARDLSAELELILLSSNEFWPGVQKLLQSNIVDDSWTWPVTAFDVLQLRIDKIIEKTIYKYVSEQRSPATELVSRKLDSLIELQKEPSALSIASSPLDLCSLLDEKKSSESSALEQLINNLKNQNPQSDFIYLKNYPARDQLLIYKTSFAEANYFRGQSFHFIAEAFKNDPELIVQDLKTKIEESLRCGPFDLVPVVLADQVYGFLLTIQYSDVDNLKRISRHLGMFLRNVQLENSQQGPDQDVSLEQEVSFRQFPLVLSKEISRGRRLKLPVTLLLLQVEHVYNQDHNRRQVFDLIKDSLRSYDFITQMENGQLAIILPHCAYEDGAIKAENLRRQIVTKGIQSQSAPLRLCFGVSEFPRLSIDSDSLIEDAKKACAQVYSSGKNKVCLYYQDETFEPEY